MYDPYNRDYYRQQRRLYREQIRQQRAYYRYQNPFRGAAIGIFVLILIFGFSLGGGFHFISFLSLLFIGLGILSLLGAFSTFNHRTVYGGMWSFIWLVGLGICFTIGFWPWILLPVIVGMFLGSFYRPITNGLGNTPWLAPWQMPPQAQPGYTPPPPQQEPNQQQPASYQQGYQPQQPPPVYHPVPPVTPDQPKQQFEQPVVENPQQEQELPPMEQQG